MGFMITLSVLLIAGAVVGVITQRCAGRPRRSSALSDLDAEAEANQWLVRLGGCLLPPDARAWAGADDEAGRALTRAAECHRAARERLAVARTAGEYERVTWTAKEGLQHVRAARRALRLTAEPADGGAHGAPRRSAGVAVP